jgi:hypothetical protein
MPKLVIDKLEGGLLPDQANYNLPEGFFSSGQNVRWRDDTIEKIAGTDAIFGSLSSTAIWASAISDGITPYWIYGNESILYATDGATHAQVSTASYNAAINLGYTGGVFHGFQILNDANVVPQRWAPGLANKVRDLENWPAMTFAKVIRPFGNFLVAMRITQDGVYNPRLLRWSDAAAFGALPSSWDYTDPTNLAGITELGHTEDEIVDGGALRDSFVVYKNGSTFLMTPIGGLDVFSFREAFTESGLLSENCFVSFGERHFVVSDHDIVVHDGSSIQSVADKRVRRQIFNSIDTGKFQRSFVVKNRRERQIWVCIPESGNDYPNIAWVWSISDNTWHLQELGGLMAYGAEGVVVGAELTFDGLSGTFDDQDQTFDEQSFTPFARRLVLWRGNAQKALQTGSTGGTFDGSPILASITRANMGLSRDVNRKKTVKRVFPKVFGPALATVNIYVGSANAIDSPVFYQGPFPYTIGSSYKIDCRISGRFFHMRMEHNDASGFRLSGFDVEFDDNGYR